MSIFPMIYAIAQDKHLFVGEAFKDSDNRVRVVVVNRNMQDWEVAEYENFLQLMATVRLNSRRDRLC